MKSSGGNGAGVYQITTMDMGGWVRVFSARGGLAPADLPVYLSQALSDWFRAHSNHTLQFAFPVCDNGNTVELHGFYHTHVLPPLQGPQPVRRDKD
jgi:hypothetical protein